VNSRLASYLTYACLIIMLPAPIIIVFTSDYDDFSLAMFWLLGAGALAGIASASRASLVDSPDSTSKFTAMFRDLGIVLAAEVVVFYIVVIVGFAVGATHDATLWYMPLLYLLLGVMGMGFGVIAGLVIVIPIGILAKAVNDRAHGRTVDPFIVILALVFLAVATFAIVGVLAIHDTDTLQYRGRYYYDIFIVLTNAPSDTVTIVSQPLAWTARGVFIALVLLVAVAAHLGRAKQIARRVSKSAGAASAG
jgi:hypothetical protein